MEILSVLTRIKTNGIQKLRFFQHQLRNKA